MTLKNKSSKLGKNQVSVITPFVKLVLLFHQVGFRK